MGDEDVPRIMAAAMVDGTGAALRVGLSYLRMRRDARRSGKRLYQELVRNGMSKERARHMRGEWEASISLRGILGGIREWAD